MDDFADFLGGVVMFFLRSVVFAFYSIFLLVGGIFSSAMRAQLKNRWRTSTWEQASMITGTLLGMVLIFVTLAHVVPVFSSSDEEAGVVQASSSKGEEATQDEDGVGESLREKAIDKGVEYLKNKLRKEE